MTNVIEIVEGRSQSLARLEAQIREMEKVKRRLASGGPAYVLVQGIINRLKAKAEERKPAPVRASARKRAKMN
jgi:hypothetical protein